MRCCSARSAIRGSIICRARRAWRPGLLALRKALGVYANLRPAQVWPVARRGDSFKPERVRGTNLVDCARADGRTLFRRAARHSSPITATTRCATARPRSSASRSGVQAGAEPPRKLLFRSTSTTCWKCRLWRSVMTRLASKFPDVTLEHRTSMRSR